MAPDPRPWCCASRGIWSECDPGATIGVVVTVWVTTSPEMVVMITLVTGVADISVVEWTVDDEVFDVVTGAIGVGVFDVDCRMPC